MTTIYVGGSSQDLLRVKAVMTTLRIHGHKITHNWTTRFDEPTKDYVSFALEDIEGIRRAQKVLLIFQQPLEYRGTHSELGMAIILDKPILILGKEADKNIFSRLPQVTIYYNLNDVISDL